MKSPEDFSMLDPKVSSEPWDLYQVLHEQCPVYQMPETGAFVVTRYEDLRAVLKNHEIPECAPAPAHHRAPPE